MTPERVECVLLAGAPAGPEIASLHNVEWRSDAVIAGKRMIEWVLGALRDSGRISRIILVGPHASDADQQIEPGETFLENMMKGVRAAEGPFVLVASSDIPLADGHAFAALVDRGLELNADFVYPVIRKDACDAKYPQLKRTFLKVKEGTFTGGNAVLIRRDFALRAEGRIESLYQARKEPLKLARMVGVGALIRVIMAQKLWQGAVSIGALEAAAERVMPGKLRALICPDPEIGEDLDHPADLAEAEKILLARNASSPAA